MSLNVSRVRSELPNVAEVQRLLAKIKTQKLVFQVGDYRVKASACTNVLIDEAAVSGQIQFQRPGGGAVEFYDLTDLQMIKRLRTKKWLIKIKGTANPAA